ncbi:futalosine hydrolase [Staphylospora marina]|uniref:futalosine hydrolase n=1 Tax=Staphylospora marina TaxID=2490858 RepID=UPI000F5C0A5C|nr:futalosine hydrolase [Staphylospora marina]
MNRQDMQSDGQPRVLIVTAVDAEREAVLRGLEDDPRFSVIAAGVGPAEAAVRTTLALSVESFDLVVCMGIAGGFAGRAEVGTLVMADEIIAADLGAETPDGFLSLDELGFGSSRIPVDRDRAGRWTEALRKAGLPVTMGQVLTVSTVTGTAESADRLVRRNPNAVAEAMEGFGVALAARAFGVPALELRSVSNPVGPRDKSLWKMAEALEKLTQASAVIREMTG